MCVQLFALVQPRDIRSIITKAPVNMKTLVCKAMEVIVSVFRDYRIGAPNGCVVQATSDPRKAFVKTTIEKLNNAVRILVRVLPFVFEDRGYNWKQELFSQPLPGSASNKTVAEELVDSLYLLLFLPSYTLPPNAVKRKDGTYFIIWEAGIAAKVAPPSTVEIDNNRFEVLKLLLVLMSPVLYMNPCTSDLVG